MNQLVNHKKATMTTCGMFEAKTHFSQLVDSLVSGRTDCVRVSRRGVPVVQITIVRKDAPSRPRLGLAKGRFRLPTWEEDKAMDREIECAFAGGAR